ncbi:MAG: phosphonopyruvate decarboxylase [Candidatus Cloacimonetes bacterium]|nr:phosphonopyruvate decarboxylase [Candidatus Cloacimonadota bacterium]
MGISPLIFYKILDKNNIDFFTGVPDSLLKQFCFCLDDNVPKERHIVAANEGNAIAIAAGYHLATGKLPMVYMQNSGLGNSVNPLLSLCDPDVYSIPVLVLIGWRGEPGVYDEPQHVKQGKVQLDLLQAMDIPYEIISKDEKQIDKKITNAVEKTTKEKRPFAIVVKKGTFAKYKDPLWKLDSKLMTREESLEIILNKLPEDSIVISTTGKTSREIYEIREKNREPHFKDFLTVGSMGHCSSIAFGIAIAKPDRNVICIDGDGSFIMHMGFLSTVGKLKPRNFYHILINNFVHESVGGQETGARFIDVPMLVESNGYKNVYSVKNDEELINHFCEFIQTKGPNFLEIKIRPGSKEELGRPTLKPIDNKIAFMRYISQY